MITGTNEVYANTAKESVQKLKNTSPKREVRGGKYSRSWTIKTVKGGSLKTDNVIIHNKIYYLTHLLEKGHAVIRNGKMIGRANPIKHIEPVDDWAADELVSRIKRKLT